MGELRKKAILLLLLFSMVGSMAACEKKAEPIVEEPIEQEMEEVSAPQREGVPSPISGIYASEEKVNRRPLAIVFDNQSAARPQAGLIDAEIAYEFLAEGNITRYLGIFLLGEPETIGSIRSARPYFIEKALEFDGHFVHVGGSPQAFQDIATYKLQNINAMNRGSDVFWRKSHKKVPHNMYSSYEALRKAAEVSKYRVEPNVKGFTFHEDVTSLEGELATKVRVTYSKGYEPSYTFDGDNRLYLRYYNGKPHLDEVSGEQLKATNIIIQEVPAKVVDSELRLEMGTIGEGKGKYISDGKSIDITWKKTGYEQPTQYFNLEGRELILNPGKTWVQVVRDLKSVHMNE